MGRSFSKDTLSWSGSHPGTAQGWCRAAVSNGCGTGRRALLLMSAAQVLFNGSFIINGSVALFALLGSCGYFFPASSDSPTQTCFILFDRGESKPDARLHRNPHQSPGDLHRGNGCNDDFLFGTMQSGHFIVKQ